MLDFLNINSELIYIAIIGYVLIVLIAIIGKIMTKDRTEPPVKVVYYQKIEDPLWLCSINLYASNYLQADRSERMHILQELQVKLKETLCYDENYISNYFLIKDKDISSLSCHEIYSWLTYLFEIEKYEEGIIQENIKNGTFTRLLGRYTQFTSPTT